MSEFQLHVVIYSNNIFASVPNVYSFFVAACLRLLMQARSLQHVDALTISANVN